MTKVRSFFRSMVLMAGMSTLAACQTMTGAGLSTSCRFPFNYANRTSTISACCPSS